MCSDVFHRNNSIATVLQWCIYEWSIAVCCTWTTWAFKTKKDGPRAVCVHLILPAEVQDTLDPNWSVSVWCELQWCMRLGSWHHQVDCVAILQFLRYQIVFSLQEQQSHITAWRLHFTLHGQMYVDMWTIHPYVVVKHVIPEPWALICCYKPCFW